MPNKNYIKGRRKEYKIMNDLREEGYSIVQRSAGSHSPIDVFAINKEKKVIKLIQVKPDNFSKLNTKHLVELWEWLNGEFTIEFEII